MENIKTKNKDMGAFACVDPEYLQHGLTKREYFAAMALQGLMVVAINGRHNQNVPMMNEGKAKHAVNVADALLEELNNKP